MKLSVMSFVAEMEKVRSLPDRAVPAILQRFEIAARNAIIDIRYGRWHDKDEQREYCNKVNPKLLAGIVMKFRELQARLDSLERGQEDTVNGTSELNSN